MSNINNNIIYDLVKSMLENERQDFEIDREGYMESEPSVNFFDEDELKIMNREYIVIDEDMINDLSGRILKAIDYDDPNKVIEYMTDNDKVNRLIHREFIRKVLKVVLG